MAIGVQKRDNEYYIQRLKKGWPSLYKDVQAGKISVATARKRASLGGQRSRLHELKNAWAKATPAERSDFLSWAYLVPPVGPPLPKATSAWDADRTMLEWARRRIPEIMQRRHLSPGAVADELGIKRLNPSVMMAVHKGSRVQSSSTAKAVDKWLSDNSSV